MQISGTYSHSQEHLSYTHTYTYEKIYMHMLIHEHFTHTKTLHTLFTHIVAQTLHREKILYRRLKKGASINISFSPLHLESLDFAKNDKKELRTSGGGCGVRQGHKGEFSRIRGLRVLPSNQNGHTIVVAGGRGEIDHRGAKNGP